MADQTLSSPTSTTEATPQPTATLDPARQQQARRYATLRRWLGLADLALGAVALGVVFALGLHLRLRDALAGLATWQPAHGWAPLLVAAYSAIFIVGYTLLTLPLGIYGGFTLPHRFGLGRQTFGAWLGDQAKGTALSLVLGVGMLEVLYLLLATQPLTWWLWLGAILLVFTVILANLAPVLILPLFFKLEPMPDGDLRDRLLRMAERAHTRVRGVFVMQMSRKTSEGNAAVMGLGNTRRIVVGDTILRDYTPDEVEVVLAHELGHQVHADIWKGILVQTVLTLGGLALVNLGLHAIVGQAGAGLTGLSDAATLPVLALLFGLYGLVTGPLGNTYSRMVETQADQYALDMTRDPATFISAFHRLANQNLAQLDPNPVVEALFYDHPAIGRRIRHAEQWRSGPTPSDGEGRP
jgi:STE24 endopeptidase